MVQVVTQLSVHMENRPGALSELTEIFLAAGVNLRAISVPDTGEFGTVRVLTDDVDDARDALNEAGMPHVAADVLAVEIRHRSGALARLVRVLAEASVVIRYAYATIGGGTETSLCILGVDDIQRARDVLDKKLTD
jgi:hypothetical protein